MPPDLKSQNPFPLQGISPPGHSNDFSENEQEISHFSKESFKN